MKAHSYLIQVVLDEVRAIKALAIEQKLAASLFVTSLILIGYYLEPSPPKKITIAGYADLVEVVHGYFKKEGFEVISAPSVGSIENAELLANPKSGVDVAFIQGGAIDDALASKIESLGSIAYEPIWIFYQKSLGKKMTSLKDFGALKVGVGPEKGGTRPMAKALFALDGISIDNNPHFKVDSYEKNEQDFRDGKLDAIMVVTPFGDPDIQRLLRDPKAALFDFGLASAYAKKISYIEEVHMPKGSIDIEHVIPPNDVRLIATTTSLAVRKDLNKDLQFLLLMAVKNFNRNPTELFFSKREEFPAYMDPTIKASPVALKFYDYGIPEAMRYLPLSIAGFANRFWVFIISLATILYATTKLNVHLRTTRYHIQHRHGYEKLLEIEKHITHHDISPEQKAEYIKEIEHLNEHAISEKVPIGCEHDYFQFLHAIELVSAKLNRG